MTRLFLAAAAGALIALSATHAWAGLKAVQIGRFAHFLDTSSVTRTGDVVSFRYLLVPPQDFEAGGEPFWGGWSYMDIDCRARTADLTGFQSVRVGGAEGPRSADRQPGWPIASGSLEAALGEAACDGRFALGEPAVADVGEAVRLGRGWLDE